MEKIKELLDSRMQQIKDMASLQADEAIQNGNATEVELIAKKLAKFNAYDIQVRANIQKFYGDWYGSDPQEVTPPTNKP
jgi:hypothetical protein